ncbi:EAL domain-containing protein [Anaerorhabdus sp.]|uniref:EAL domain-containing protein n=1 Tax=Anaerorhabdus sp. TaxID=1872524 RepID=UPI002FC72F31
MDEMKNEDWLKEKYDLIPDYERKEYAIVSLKIKQFRRLNMRYGRDFIDGLIRSIYDGLCEFIGDAGYVCHLSKGSYNLLLKLPEGNRDDMSLFPWIVDIAHSTYHLKDEQYKKLVYCGIGVYILEDKIVDFYTAQYYADICRSESKEKDYVVSHVEFYGTSYVDYRLNAQEYRKKLGDALENGYIKMFLQPKVNLKTGLIESAEALMRWFDPELGLLPINEYLPIFEECGQTNLIDCYIFEEACKTIEKWNKQYHQDISISVNLSKSTFDYPYFLQEFDDIYNKYEIKKDCIELELIEKIIMDQMDKIQAVVEEIRNDGYRVSLDDFGSGYSSYSVLCNAPLHVLKIDRSMFQNQYNMREQIMIKHIIEIAHELGIEVVAEGIETESYAKELIEKNCDYIQGFVYYKPMPVDEFEERFLINKEKIEI